jgi:hypothetical protein
LKDTLVDLLRRDGEDDAAGVLMLAQRWEVLPGASAKLELRLYVSATLVSRISPAALRRCEAVLAARLAPLYATADVALERVLILPE